MVRWIFPLLLLLPLTYSNENEDTVQNRAGECLMRGRGEDPLEKTQRIPIRSGLEGEERREELMSASLQ